MNIPKIIILPSIIVLVLLPTVVAAQHLDDDMIATLYRSSLVIENARMHIATFDSTQGGFAYNWENCMVAAELFQNQEGVRTRFWCEKGKYRE